MRLSTVLCFVFALSGVVQAQNAPPQLPVLVPESAGKVTTGIPGRQAHTRLRFLVTTAATPSTASQVNTPAMIRSAYNLPSTGGAGAIALVDAYHYPTA